MSAVEYSLIFMSIVIGYVVTIVMIAWGKLIKYYDPEKFSWDYLLWSLILFFYLLFMWFWTFSYHLPYLDSYFWFTLLLIRPLIIYFCLEVLVPEKYEKYDYREHFKLSRNKFFIVVTALWCFEICLILLQDLSLNFTTRSLIYIIGLPISISLIFVNREKYVRFATIIFFILIIVVLGHDMLSQYMYGS